MSLPLLPPCGSRSRSECGGPGTGSEPPHWRSCGRFPQSPPATARRHTADAAVRAGPPAAFPGTRSAAPAALRRFRQPPSPRGRAPPASRRRTPADPEAAAAGAPSPGNGRCETPRPGNSSPSGTPRRCATGPGSPPAARRWPDPDPPAATDIRVQPPLMFRHQLHKGFPILRGFVGRGFSLSTKSIAVGLKLLQKIRPVQNRSYASGRSAVPPPVGRRHA